MSIHHIIAVRLTLIACCCLITVLAICELGPCKHGKCVEPFIGGYNWNYTCECDQGYVGAQCQWDNVKCHEDTTTPCQNNAKCVDLQDGRFCECPYSTCEIVDPCESCPDGTSFCYTAPIKIDGRLCLNSHYRDIEFLI